MRKSRNACIGDDWVNCSNVPEYKEELDFEWVRDCNTWDAKKCPSPCETYSCPDFAKCIDLSTLTDPVPHCECQMGRVMLPETGQCIKPLPPPPTPRPIPVLDEVSIFNTYMHGLISKSLYIHPQETWQITILSNEPYPPKDKMLRIVSWNLFWRMKQN